MNWKPNRRHVEATKLEPNERDLISMLQEVFVATNKTA